MYFTIHNKAKVMATRANKLLPLANPRSAGKRNGWKLTIYAFVIKEGPTGLLSKKKETVGITKNWFDSLDASRRWHRAGDGEDLAARLEEPLYGGGLGPCWGRPSPALRTSPPLPLERAAVAQPPEAAAGLRRHQRRRGDSQKAQRLRSIPLELELSRTEGPEGFG